MKALQDAKFNNQDIYLLYIDFKNAFGSIDHAQLLKIMINLGYPLNAINIVDTLHSDPSTIFTSEYFGSTQPISILYGTIQNDTFSLLFKKYIFLEPLLWRLNYGNHGYQFCTFSTIANSATYANDLIVLSCTPQIIQIQVDKRYINSVHGWEWI